MNIKVHSLCNSPKDYAELKKEDPKFYELYHPLIYHYQKEKLWKQRTDLWLPRVLGAWRWEECACGYRPTSK
jgi:hypothetical protein